MFEVYQSEKNQEYYFRLKAKNGQVIMTSQGYSAKSGAMNGVESVKKNASDESRFEKKIAANGKFFFSLKAGNGQVIGSSQMYQAEIGRDNGIASVQKNADGEVKDLTA
ncbi:MAG: YegP family protein [Bacteroidota bacterium]